MTSPTDYVARGWKIIPCHSIQRGRCTCSAGINCQSPGKHPRTRNGINDATASPDAVRAWQARWPDANWAVATGRVNDLVVIDIDPRHGGYDSLRGVRGSTAQRGALPETLTVVDWGRRSSHVLPEPARGDRTRATTGRKWLKGVDVKSDGGYVICQRASHISGGRYTWINWHDDPSTCHLTSSQTFPRVTSRSPPGRTSSDTYTILQGVPRGGARRHAVPRGLSAASSARGQGSARGRGVDLGGGRNCTPPFPEDEAMRKVDQALRQERYERVRTGWSRWLEVGRSKPAGVDSISGRRRRSCRSSDQRC